MRCLFCVSLLPHALAGLGDVDSLLQYSLKVPTVASSVIVSNFLRDLITKANLTQSKAEEAALRQQTLARPVLGEFVRSARIELKPREELLAKGWSAFFEKASSGGSSNPEDLLEHAKMALLETGALNEMYEASRASSSILQKTEGAVPLDSMLVGFRTSLAPWNNVLKEFSLPLIKATFTLFANFFGPEGNAARLCVSAAVQTDSTYGVHNRWEFGGISIFAGPAKWDNVPGWNFGASGGIDDMKYFDVSDFGWKWTLATEPETFCFFFDICVIDSEGLHRHVASPASPMSLLQEKEESEEIPIHGSTWIEHVWCSPDWTNTPLVIQDEPSGGGASPSPGDVQILKASPDNSDLPNEVWDPQTEESAV